MLLPFFAKPINTPIGGLYALGVGNTSITVGNHTNFLRVKMRGAGGRAKSSDNYRYPSAGGGGTVLGLIPVTPGETLSCHVGDLSEGGYSSNAGPLSSGGGMTWIKRGSVWIMVAGGGGGGFSSGVTQGGGGRAGEVYGKPGFRYDDTTVTYTDNGGGSTTNPSNMTEGEAGSWGGGGSGYPMGGKGGSSYGGGGGQSYLHPTATQQGIMPVSTGGQQTPARTSDPDMSFAGRGEVWAAQNALAGVICIEEFNGRPRSGMVV